MGLVSFPDHNLPSESVLELVDIPLQMLSLLRLDKPLGSQAWACTYIFSHLEARSARDDNLHLEPLEILQRSLQSIKTYVVLVQVIQF